MAVLRKLRRARHEPPPLEHRPCHSHLENVEFEVLSGGAVQLRSPVGKDELSASSLLSELAGTPGRFTAPFTLQEYSLWQVGLAGSAYASAGALAAVLKVRVLSARKLCLVRRRLRWSLRAPRRRWRQRRRSAGRGDCRCSLLAMCLRRPGFNCSRFDFRVATRILRIARDTAAPACGCGLAPADGAHRRFVSAGSIDAALE